MARTITSVFGALVVIPRARSVVCVAVATASLIASSADAQTWREYRYSGFAVQFPVEPIVENGTYTLAEGIAVAARIYSAQQDGLLYKATVADLSRSDLNEKQAIDLAIEHLTAGGEVTVDVPHRVNRVLGRQLSIMRGDGSRTAVALFYRNRRLYLIEGTILATHDDLMSPDGMRFQQSLRFILNNARGDFLCEFRRGPRNLVDGTR